MIFPTRKKRQQHNMRSYIKTITPDVARQMLERNRRNRPISASNLSRLTNEIRSGMWRLNGETIIIDSDGGIHDGQHRLLAVVASGITIQSWVIEGVDPDSFSTVDSGKPRSGADVLAVDGHKQCNRLVAALAFVEQYKRGKLCNGNDFSNREIVDLAGKHENMQASVQFAGSFTKQKLMPQRVIAGLHFLFSEVDEVGAVEFFEMVHTDIGHKEVSPIVLLRKVLISNSQSRAKLTAYHIAALTIKAWNATRAGSRIKVLRFSPGGELNESFPKIVGF